MAKVAVLVPYREMCEIARPLADEYPHIDIMCLEYIQTDRVEARARQLEEDGCELIVARGVHAGIIKRSVRVPLVEIRVTAQELGMVMLDIKHQLGLNSPRIGLIGYPNMFCDTTPFNVLFGIELRGYMVEHSEELTAALETAARVCYAIVLEKRNSAEMDTMLNYTFTGIMRVDRDSCVQRVNRVGYDMLGRPPARCWGARRRSCFRADPKGAGGRPAFGRGNLCLSDRHPEPGAGHQSGTHPHRQARLTAPSSPFRKDVASGKWTVSCAGSCIIEGISRGTPLPTPSAKTRRRRRWSGLPSNTTRPFCSPASRAAARS